MYYSTEYFDTIMGDDRFAAAEVIATEIMEEGICIQIGTWASTKNHAIHSQRINYSYNVTENDHRWCELLT